MLFAKKPEPTEDDKRAEDEEKTEKAATKARQWRYELAVQAMKDSINVAAPGEPASVICERAGQLASWVEKSWTDTAPKPQDDTEKDNEIRS